MNEKGSKWAAFALLLIDVQEDFWSAETEQAFPHFRQNIARLLRLCREEGIEVIHVRGCFSADGTDWMPVYRLGRRMPCVEGTPGIALLDEARELPGERVLEKQSFDAFLMEELVPHLEHNNRRFLLTAGLVTSICVFLTTVAAMQRGYLTAIIEDCCADEPAAHKHTLERYNFLFDTARVEDIPDRHTRWQEMIDTLVTN